MTIASRNAEDVRQTLSVVSPVFNNQGSIDELVRRIVNVRKTEFPDMILEIVLVDDGSTDESSWTIREAMARGFVGVSLRMVRLSRNFGQVSAIVAGVSVSSGDAVVVISADLQDPPEMIAQMVQAYKSGTEVVIGARADREDGAVASLFSRLSYSVARRQYPEMPVGGFDFFLLSRRAADQFVLKKGKKRFLQGEIFELGLQREIIEYRRRARQSGKSQWKFWKRVEYFFDLLLSSTNLPIRFATFVGFLSILGSIAYAIIVLFARISGSVPMDGWTPVVLLILFFGGLTVLLLGLIGEYIWRIYEEVSGKRQYLIEFSEDSKG